jgi:hypothetical protein
MPFAKDSQEWEFDPKQIGQSRAIEHDLHSGISGITRVWNFSREEPTSQKAPFNLGRQGQLPFFVLNVNHDYQASRKMLCDF